MIPDHPKIRFKVKGSAEPSQQRQSSGLTTPVAGPGFDPRNLDPIFRSSGEVAASGLVAPDSEQQTQEGGGSQGGAGAATAEATVGGVNGTVATNDAVPTKPERRVYDLPMRAPQRGEIPRPCNVTFVDVLAYLFSFQVPKMLSSRPFTRCRTYPRLRPAGAHWRLARVGPNRASFGGFLETRTGWFSSWSCTRPFGTAVVPPPSGCTPTAPC